MPRTAAPPNGTSRSSNTIQCFKPGRHKAMNGQVIEFAESDLAATAGAYDPALWRAPIVIGHPKIEDSAYGWVDALQHTGGALEAVPGNVNPAFAALVDDKAYANVSLCFWSPTAPGNPVPGVYYPRHLGFLGAVPPAVMGMRQPAFSADQLARFGAAEEGLVEFAAWDDVDNASLWRGLRDWVLAKFGQADADTALPPYLVASVERAAQAEMAAAQANATDTPAAPAFAAAANPDPVETPAVTEAEKLALQAENNTLKQQIKDAAAASRRSVLATAHADAVAFADSLVQDARLPDGKRDAVVATLDALAEHAESTGAVLQFGQGDAAKPLLPEVKALLAGLPKIAALGRMATTATTAAAEGAVEPKLIGTQNERRAAIGAMFPDLPSSAASATSGAAAG